MKLRFSALTAILIVSIFGVRASPQEQRPGMPEIGLHQIWFHDDRKDFHEITSREVRGNASGVAALILYYDRIFEQEDGTQKIIVKELLSTKYYTKKVEGKNVTAKMCAGVKFARQPIAARCTAFLVSDDTLVTAKHCLDEDIEKKNARAVFGFASYSPGTYRITFKRDAVYELDAPGMRPCKNGQDCVMVKMKRAAAPRFKRLKIAAAVTPNAPVYVIGFPQGLPLKVAGNDPDARATVKPGTINDYTFEATLDTFGGNSGSPIFNSSHQAIGILTSGEDDLELAYNPISKAPCWVLHHAKPGQRGETGTRVTQLPYQPQSQVQQQQQQQQRQQ